MILYIQIFPSKNLAFRKYIMASGILIFFLQENLTCVLKSFYTGIVNEGFYFIYLLNFLGGEGGNREGQE